MCMKILQIEYGHIVYTHKSSVIRSNIYENILKFSGEGGGEGLMMRGGGRVL